MALLDKLNSSYKFVCANSKHVKINYSKVDEMIKKIETSSVNYWIASNPFGVLDMDLKSIIYFLFIYHTIGDYCFWGDPKWEIKTNDGILDGSYAIMYLIIERFKNNSDFEMSFEEFRDMLKGNVEIPLLKNRYNNLMQLNEFLKKYEKTFYDIIISMHIDIKLLEFIVSNLPYFEDIAEYKGKKIYFYKRAQLLTSDLLHVMEYKEKISVDYSHLIGCADYKIPQVMRCYEMLTFDEELSKMVDQKKELLENSNEEIEIRAADLAIINYIYEKLDKKYTRMEINDFLWLLGQDKTKMIKPYHRTKTSHY